MEGAISSSSSLTTRERSKTALKLHFQLIPWAPGFIWGTGDSPGGLKEEQGDISVLAPTGEEGCDEGKEAILDFWAFFHDYSHRVYPSLVANSTSEMEKIILDVLEKVKLLVQFN